MHCSGGLDLDLVCVLGGQGVSLGVGATSREGFTASQGDGDAEGMPCLGLCHVPALICWDP